MGVSYLQLLKDVCGWEATQWENTGQCACSCVQFPALEKYKILIKKSRTRSVVSSRACLCLKRKRKYQPSWGYAWTWDEVLEWQCYTMSLRAILPNIKLCQGSYHEWLRAPMPSTVISLTQYDIEPSTQTSYFCEHFLSQCSQITLHIPLMMQASVGNSSVTWNSAWFGLYIHSSSSSDVLDSLRQLHPETC